ncbi:MULTISPECIES: septation ring formation regulator EzrA [unclassified Gemella]|uniref:septation ring formation regulator EzrA n=1 Tax=unclassified Gemella TaxID=2624949 RepID=UPI0010736703|nr:MULTISPECIES: septation ring formation regulator EzrA [unclassified Gemella]MBF0710220.1 selenide, water dikinase [Gemella sp. GL1.1]MBF0746520.1 selenide, water dikinase [Gemella sp. 19428wG2_WT2a]NYS27564.1 selenide, water dikinase [Gemella sp. GL1]TFU60298.1 selenide, water dikinase [Gemella sp. WT2a]
MIYFYSFLGIAIVAVVVYLFMLRNRKKQDLLPLLEIKDNLERETLSEELKEVKNLNLAGKALNRYEDWESAWYEIQSIDLDELDKDLELAESYIDKFNFKNAEEVIFNCDSNINNINEKILTIRKEIKELKEIDPKNKEKYEEIVKEYKELNRELLAKRHQYGGAAETFEKDIKGLAPELDDFKALTASGKYIEAQETIRDINLKIQNLKERMVILPDIIKEIEKTTPAQIQSLRLKVEEMEKKGFKLSHLEISTKVENCVWQLNDAREKVKTGDIDLIESILDGIYDVIEEVSNGLKKEIDYKKYVEQNYSEVSNRIKNQDKLNQALYDNIQEIKNRYQIYSEDEEMVSKNYDLLGNILDVKHDIDVYISNQPRLNYKDLKEKIEKLSQDIEKIEEEQAAYSRYLTSLREEEVTARNKINFINQEKEVVRRKLSNSRVPGFSDRFIVLYKEVADSYKYALEELKKEPMNIDLVKEAVTEAEESLSIYKNEVENILTDIDLIEKLIRYSNRYRRDNADLHKQLSIAEQYYKEYRYNKTLDIIRTSLEKVEAGAYDRIKKEVKGK